MTDLSKIEKEDRRKNLLHRWFLASPALFVVMIAAIGPLLIMVFYSLLEKGSYGGVEWAFSIKGWQSVFLQRDIFDDTLSIADAHIVIFWRSVKLSLLTTGLTLIFGFPTAYFIATQLQKRRDLWVFLITIPFWTNLLIRTFAIQELIRRDGVINLVLTSLGIIDTPIQMLNTDFAIAFGMTYVYMPLMVLPVYSSLEKMDFSLIEAGYDLYAGRLAVLWHIILPLVRPGLVAGSILVFIPSLGAYVTPELLGGGKKMMISNLISLQFGQGRNWPLGAALAIALMVIVMLAMTIYVRQISKVGKR